MLVLALDTSSPAVTAAVLGVDGGELRLLGERIVSDARGHGEWLTPNIQAALAEAAIVVAQLDAVVVGTGPGPYTGLRVGLVTAAVLAEARGIPAYGVPSLDAIGAALPDEPALLVATDARRREVYWATYAYGVRTGELGVDRPADVPIGGCTAVAGPELADFGLPRRDVTSPPPAALVGCAVPRLAAGAPSDALTPLYLRRPDAQVPSGRKPVTP